MLLRIPLNNNRKVHKRPLDPALLPIVGCMTTKKKKIGLPIVVPGIQSRRGKNVFLFFSSLLLRFRAGITIGNPTRRSTQRSDEELFVAGLTAEIFASYKK